MQGFSASAFAVAAFSVAAFAFDATNPVAGAIAGDRPGASSYRVERIAIDTRADFADSDRPVNLGGGRATDIEARRPVVQQTARQAQTVGTRPRHTANTTR